MTPMGRSLAWYVLYRRQCTGPPYGEASYVADGRVQVAVYPGEASEAQRTDGIAPSSPAVGHTFRQDVRVGDGLGDADGPRWRVTSVRLGWTGSTLGLEDTAHGGVA